MRAADPGLSFLIVLIIGVAAGWFFHWTAAPSWFTRQISGATRGLLTHALVGVAGAFIGFHLFLILQLGGMVVAYIGAAILAVLVLLVWRMVR